jgi:hypothetical protein
MNNKPVIYAMSDLHGNLPDPASIPPCDIFLLAGDVTPVHNHLVPYQKRWLTGPFKEWIDQVDAQFKIMTPGNHDFCFEDPSCPGPWIYELGCQLLIDQEVVVGGVRIYGTPWTPLFGGWAFMRDEEFLRTVFAQIPSGLDILLSHGPPRQYCDRNWQGLHCGSTALQEQVRIVRPQAVVCGHIHEGYGLRDVLHLGSSVPISTVYNVSHVDGDYRPVNPAVQIHLPR